MGEQKGFILKHTKELKGILEVMTGLHIGAGNNAIEIGGMDNPIVKDPATNEPYIPGSSLKGKMRSLSEWFYGKVSTNSKSPGRVCDCGKKECEICRVFGTNAPGSNPNEKDRALNRGPTRLIVRDARLKKGKDIDDDILIEEKWENTINRITASAIPRQIERVVPGTQFDFEISYRVMCDGDRDQLDENYFDSVVLLSIYLLELDYLGGGGSRGNGKIIFKSLTLDGVTIKDDNGIWIDKYKTKLNNLYMRKTKVGETNASDKNVQTKT